MLLMMETVRICETSVNFNDARRRYIPQVHLHTRSRENLKSQDTAPFFIYYHQEGVKM
jgi:hypothetical protein